jgi:hypothetical protein
LPQRLKPETGELRGLLRGAVVCAFLAGLIGYAIATRPGDSVTEVKVALGLMLLFALGFVVAALRNALRRASASAPFVEVDSQPWRVGQRHQVRLVVPDAAALIELDVSLEALDWVQVNASRRGRKSQLPVHRSTLLRLTGAELEAARAGGSIDRTLDVALPPDAAGRDWLWGINVRGITQAFSELQQKVFARLVEGRISAPGGDPQLQAVAHEMRERIGSGAPAWEDFFRLEVERV